MVSLIFRFADVASLPYTHGNPAVPGAQTAITKPGAPVVLRDPSPSTNNVGTEYRSTACTTVPTYIAPVAIQFTWPGTTLFVYHFRHVLVQPLGICHGTTGDVLCSVGVQTCHTPSMQVPGVTILFGLFRSRRIWSHLDGVRRTVLNHQA